MNKQILCIVMAAMILSSCGGIGLSENQRDEVSDIASDYASNDSASQEEIDRLERKIDALESLIRAQSDYIDALDGSLKEARENHSALLETFNANVEKNIQRNRYVDQELCSIGIGNCRR